MDYTKRLDEILDRFAAGAIEQGMGEFGITFSKCEGQITQLFRDMVMEAKPKLRNKKQEWCTHCRYATDAYESNLLKMIGEDHGTDRDR